MKEILYYDQDWMIRDIKCGTIEIDKAMICYKKIKVPETWDELVEETILKRLTILGKSFRNRLRESINERREFMYRGYTYTEKGSIRKEYFDGTSIELLKGFSIEQLFFFFLSFNYKDK